MRYRLRVVSPLARRVEMRQDRGSPCYRYRPAKGQ